MSSTFFDKRALKKMQAFITTAIIVVAVVAGAVYYSRALYKAPREKDI